MKKILFAIFPLFLGLSALADEVPYATALSVAKQFMETEDLTMVWDGSGLQDGTAGAPAFYVFNRGEEDGWVIIAADDQVYTVLGYADHGHFNAAELPANAFEWLESCDERFDIIINDCFLALTPEFSLLVHDGAELMRDHLNENGVYLANVVSAISGPDAATLYVTAEALRACFSHVWVYSCGLSDPFTSDNNIVIATDAPHAFVGAWEWPNLPKEA